jgi:hypothetical protein
MHHVWIVNWWKSADKSELACSALLTVFLVLVIFWRSLKTALDKFINDYTNMMRGIMKEAGIKVVR